MEKDIRPVDRLYMKLMRAVGLGWRDHIFRLVGDQIDIIRTDAGDNANGGWLASLWADPADPDAVVVFEGEGLQHASLPAGQVVKAIVDGYEESTLASVLYGLVVDAQES